MQFFGLYEKTALPKTPFRFIWHFLRPHRSVVSIYVLLAVAAGFWGPFNSLLIKQLINHLPNVAGGDVSILIFPAILLVVNFIVFDNFTWRGIDYIWARFVPVIVNRVMGETMNYVLSHSNQFYQKNVSGQVSKQIGHLGDGISTIITSPSANFLRAASLLLTAFITSYFVNAMFFFILVTWFVVFTSVSILMSKKLVGLSDA